MKAYRIISSTENMAHFIFNGMKLDGKINKWAGFPHDMQKSHETLCCYDVWGDKNLHRSKKKQNKSMEVKIIKLYQIQRCQTQWASKLQTAGGWQSIWEKHHSMPASFFSPPQTSAEDVTGPCSPVWPYEPLVWASTAVLVIASESGTAADPYTHTTHPRLTGNGHKGS